MERAALAVVELALKPQPAGLGLGLCASIQMRWPPAVWQPLCMCQVDGPVCRVVLGPRQLGHPISGSISVGHLQNQLADCMCLDELL